jgi:hypothetical protein
MDEPVLAYAPAVVSVECPFCRARLVLARMWRKPEGACEHYVRAERIERQVYVAFREVQGDSSVST